jgi:hypothetical protein
VREGYFAGFVNVTFKKVASHKNLLELTPSPESTHIVGNMLTEKTLVLGCSHKGVITVLLMAKSHLYLVCTAWYES